MRMVESVADLVGQTPMVRLGTLKVGGTFSGIAPDLKEEGPSIVCRSIEPPDSMIFLLLSTIFGAISGVGIWCTVGVDHPAVMA